MAKNTRTYWYDYVDIDVILKAKSNNNVFYYVEETASQNSAQALKRINHSFATLEANSGLKAAVIPINLGQVVHGIYRGSHWVGLAIKRNIENGNLECFYNDSLGTSMDISLPILRTILNNHGILNERIRDFKHKQQDNGYDCGAWTVLNLDNFAKTGMLSDATENNVIDQRSEVFGYSHVKTSIDKIEQSATVEESSGSIDEIADLSVKASKLNLDARVKPKFVISTIAYVPPRKYDDDSPDEELDEKFSDLMKLEYWPYQARTQTHKKTIDFKDVIVPIDASKESLSVKPFLDKLASGGFEMQEQDEVKDSVSASIALNRMRSVSTRNNNALWDELASKPEIDVKHEKFGFFWECKWVDVTGKYRKKIKYKVVKKFYKQLKRYDAENDTNYVEDFLLKTEKTVPIPYQELREYAKNHPKTTKLVVEYRKAVPNAPIYLSLVDYDTLNFNGIYSAYYRITKEKLPTVMSTGYAFPTAEQPYHLASILDRDIRVITAKYIPGGVYYPEPNTCVLIPQDSDTVPESFIDTSKEKSLKGKSESVALLRKVIEREEARFIFTDDNALVTEIPTRARLTKAHKTKIPFSKEHIEGASPTKADIRLYKQITQSHYNEKVWLDNLFMNKAIKTKQAAHCKHLITVIRNGNADEKQKAKDELITLVGAATVESIGKALVEIGEYTKKFHIQYERRGDETEFLALLEENEIQVADFSREVLLILSNSEIQELLIKSGYISLEDLVELPDKTIKCIFTPEIVELLVEEQVTFDEVLEIYDNSDENEEEFLIRLTCETEDPVDFALYFAPEVNKIVMEYLDSDDIEWIKEQLCESDRMDFEFHLGEYDAFEIESLGEDTEF